MSAASRPPVFILGIMPRCGTNFLYNLLMLHPDCAALNPVWEDYLLAHSDHLLQYGDAVSHHWAEQPGMGTQVRAHLDESLGSGITAFLRERCAGSQVVSKTPSVDQLSNFFRLFPEAKLLILVRDGRSVIESGVRSFGWRREPALHSLASAAASIHRFMEQSCDRQGQYRLVRYEDLWQECSAQMSDIIDFLQLDPVQYDFERAEDLPVRGSSDLASGSRDDLHWNPLEKPADFDPMSRFAAWSDARHYRYNQVCGGGFEAFGYLPKTVGTAAGLYRLQGILLDATWRVKSWLRPLYRRLRPTQP